jgi:hypothetical protein
MRGIGFICLALPLAASAAVTLTPSAVSPSPLGTIVSFDASVTDSGASFSYRFRTRRMGPTLARVLARRVAREDSEAGFRTIVDYGPNPSLQWTTIQAEGPYEIEVSARNNATGEISRDTTVFEFAKLADSAPVVTPTTHPLVFLYSAPPCPDGGQMRALFAQTGSPRTQQTPRQACDGRSTMNFYLAGMRAASTYRVWHTIEAGGALLDGPTLSFTTGAVTVQLPAAAPLSTPVPDYSGILWQAALNGRAFATDLNGNVLWYGPSGFSLATRLVPGGNAIAIYEAGSKGPAEQYFREFDLAGATVAETNAGRVSEQLMAMGARPITSFHHEAIRLADGRYLLLAGTEQLMDDVQDPGTVNVLGDTIVVLDSNLQVIWYWDSFDHMDPSRKAILNETCAYPASLACSTFYEAGSANDWLHGNSLQLTPDGNILYSARHQDWVIKIDFQNGLGTGDILWRLGAGGDFTLVDGDESLWFSHQHDPQLMPDGATLVLFDNGNTRINRSSDHGTSRGQVWRIDEGTRTVALLVNADLKGNSSALGSGQALANGNYHFDAGFIVNPSTRQMYTQALEVDPSGNIFWGMQITGQQYRSYRLDDLYTPPLQ